MVNFKDKVYQENSSWFPYYNNYKGHVFKVLDVPYRGHVLIRCITGLMNENNNKLPLEICIHDDEIKTLNSVEKQDFNKKLPKFIS
ncbi:hypothetical protein GW820_05025 [archaeon]|nr:hypothetical protein [archaeon]